MAILVLGGTGYIGSHTVYELIDAGRDMVVADNLQTGFKAAVHPIPAEITPRRAGDSAQLVAFSEKAKFVLDWNPQYAALEVIVSSAWNRHKSHPHGYEEG